MSSIPWLSPFVLPTARELPSKSGVDIPSLGQMGTPLVFNVVCAFHLFNIPDDFRGWVQGL